MIEPSAISDSDCAICGKSLSQHNINAGVGMCRIYPAFVSKRKMFERLAHEVTTKGEVMKTREEALEAALKQIDNIKWESEPAEKPDLATELVLHLMEKNAAMSWQPIETAVSSAALDWERANQEQRPVLVAAGGQIHIGIVRDFLGDDGTLRKGIGFAMGIFMPTHWMPLPPLPCDNGRLPEGENSEAG